MAVGFYALCSADHANKWGRSSKIQEKAQAKVDSVVTDRLKTRIQSMARESAEKGTFQNEECNLMCRSYMNKYVSPDRSGPMAQVSSTIEKALNEEDPLLTLLDQLLGDCSVKAHITADSQTAEIYSSDGELLASYNSLGGGWTIQQTKAETKFLSETSSIYAQAYEDARAEIKAAQAAARAALPDEAAVNVLA
jgi:hypothetical protein